MRGIKFSAEQMSGILNECKGTHPKEIARKYGITEKTIGNWRRKFKGMASEEIKDLRNLQDENGRLKRLVARQAYDIECLKEINAKKW